MKKAHFLLFFCFLSLALIAQQRSRNTLNMYSISSYNPAEVGSSTFGDAFLCVRNQHLGLKDFQDNAIGVNTQWYNASLPLKRIKSGLGISVITDAIGFEKTNSFKLNYAFQAKVGDGKLGFGLSLGMVNYAFDISEATFPNGITDNVGNDEWFQSRFANAENLNKFILGAGVFYRSNDIYFGIASSEINQPKFTLESTTASNDVNYIVRTFYVNAGYKYQTKNPLWIIKPTALLKTNLNFKESVSAVSQLSIEVLIQYNKFLLAGVGYTSGSDISPFLGVEINNGSKLDGLRAIAAWDFSLTALGSETYGSLEFMIGYSFNLSIEKETKSYKSVRFL